MSNKNYNIKEAYVFTNNNVSEESIATLHIESKDFDVLDEYTIVYLPIYMIMFIDTNTLI